jgi:hypothetical protein
VSSDRIRARPLTRRHRIGLTAALDGSLVWRRDDEAPKSERRQRGVELGPPSPSERGALDALVASLSQLNQDQVRLQWRNHLGGSPPAHLPGWLIMRVLAYRIQAAALGISIG